MRGCSGECVNVATPRRSKQLQQESVTEGRVFKMPPRRKRDQKQKKEEDDEQLNPAAMTVANLRAELGKRKLETTGKKAELVKRLQEAISDQPPPTKKKAKEPEPEEETDQPDNEEGQQTSFGQMAAALRKSEKGKKKRQPKVDQYVPWNTNYQVYDDWDCMLNQTNIGHNNNKYYVIQMLVNKSSGCYHVWNRWGRVGEPGQNAMKGPFTKIDPATKEFEKKFKDKTRNDWSDRANFTPVPGKYTLIDMGDEEEGEEETAMEIEETDAPPAKIKKCTLDAPTQSLVKLLFDNDMFQDAMKSLEIDTKKMPLGKLSKVQIAKGFEALEAIESALQSKAPRSRLSELSSKFYTIIPHDFGRRIPPVLDNQEMLQKKFDMLMVLGDIELAQTMQKDKIKVEAEEVPHPLDVNYKLLKANLDHVKKGDKDYQIIEKYLKATEPSYQKLEIMDIWKVDREGEGERFSEHSDIENRRLLWHGTNVAVVAAILKTGLRIMPHSGGRVGRGIYFASENSKSAGYVRCAGQTGIMFLNEVALGREYDITMDDSSLRKAPDGYHSVVARGCTEPDPKHDVTLKMDSKTVVVPQGKPIKMSKYTGSHFSQSEYLVYKESQVRVRYLLKLKFGAYSWGF